MTITEEQKAELDAVEQVTPKIMDDEDDLNEVRNLRFSMHSKLQQPQWSSDDALAVSRIQTMAHNTAEEIFERMGVVLDRLYSKARQAKRDENGKVMRNSKGRVVWERDEFGEITDDWTTVPNSEIESALMKLQEVKMFVSPKVKELFLEALFAKTSHKDDWYDEYQSVSSGTAVVREAKANQKTISGRYNHIFRYWLWSYAESIERELNATMALLGRLRSWRTKDGI